jgi:dipeptidyl-peptidase-3
MKRILNLTMIMIMTVLIFSCTPKTNNKNTDIKQKDSIDTFNFFVEQFADLKIMRYKLPLFDSLSLKQKELIYYLSQAALCGRDIIWDQNYKHNLCIRKTLENIYMTFKGDKNAENYKKFEIYLKRIEFSNGIYHHYSSDKINPDFPKEYFAELVSKSDPSKFPLEKEETIEKLIEKLTPILFDPKIDAKKICLDTKKDLVKSSSVNFYENLSQKEAEKYYQDISDKTSKTPVSYGLNSKLVKTDGKIIEKVYKIGGMYSTAIEQIVLWLDKAAAVAENEAQKKSIEKLIEYYKTGDLKTWDDFNVMWVKDLNSQVDFVNGFIEVYQDPMGRKASWESVVNFKDIAATKRTEILSSNAQWFEDNSPVDPRFKKKEVKGVSAKVITVAMLGGDCFPSTPIGINLPNADWIRKDYGSKSVTMENITYAYDEAAKGNGFLEEFSYSKEEIELDNKYGSLSDNLHTDMHECLGHGSGQLLPGVDPDAMKNFHSALEETRADLFGLYYIMDEKMIQLGLIPNLDVAKTLYNGYIRNGLMTQLVRIEAGKNIEQPHMRNRQLIAKWCFEKGQKDSVIVKKVKEGKTYFVIRDYVKLRALFGELLIEVQRIKSEGDYAAGKKLVETYAIKVNPVLHKEVLERYKKLKLAPYGGFMNPVFKLVMDGDKIVDIKIEYPDNYMDQMLNYSKNYSFLPTYN